MRAGHPGRVRVEARGAAAGPGRAAAGQQRPGGPAHGRLPPRASGPRGAPLPQPGRPPPPLPPLRRARAGDRGGARGSSPGRGPAGPGGEGPGGQRYLTAPGAIHSPPPPPAPPAPLPPAPSPGRGRPCPSPLPPGPAGRSAGGAPSPYLSLCVWLLLLGAAGPGHSCLSRWERSGSAATATIKQAMASLAASPTAERGWGAAGPGRHPPPPRAERGPGVGRWRSPRSGAGGGGGSRQPGSPRPPRSGGCWGRKKGALEGGR